MGTVAGWSVAAVAGGGLVVVVDRAPPRTTLGLLWERRKRARSSEAAGYEQASRQARHDEQVGDDATR